MADDFQIGTNVAWAYGKAAALWVEHQKEATLKLPPGPSDAARPARRVDPRDGRRETRGAEETGRTPSGRLLGTEDA